MASTEKAAGAGALAARERRTRTRELVIGFTCAAAFAVFGVLAGQIKSTGLAAQGIGPAFFPTVLAVGGALLSLLYCILVVVLPRRDDPDEEHADAPAASALRPVAIIAAPLVWVFALPFLGFVVSTWAMVTFLTLLFDGMRTRAWLVAPGVMTGGLWVIFQVILSVDLPKLSLL